MNGKRNDNQPLSFFKSCPLFIDIIPESRLSNISADRNDDDSDNDDDEEDEDGNVTIVSSLVFSIVIAQSELG